MNPLLISGFGTSINVDKRRLIVTNKLEGSRAEFYPHQIQYDSIIIDGHTGNITFEAMRWLTKHDIPITMLNWNGNLLSTTLPKEPASAKLRVKQYQKYLDGRIKYQIASVILDEKIKKSFDLLLKLTKYHTVLDKSEIERSFNNIKLKFRHSSELLTYEGNIAIFYWDQLSKVFNGLAPEFAFSNRNGRRNSWNTNASDEINAMLNYGYAIMESEVRRTINSIGFDSSIGFLHELKDGRDSLVYDVQELYRWLVDLSVIQLLEEKKLKKSDFIVTENYNIRLKPTTAKRLIEKIKLNFNARTEYKGLNYSYQNILYENVRNLANNIIDKQRTLTFNIPEIHVKREDDAEIRDRILSITPEERKELGSRRNTLWYMKKNIKNGKKIKIYNKVMDKIVD